MTVNEIQHADSESADNIQSTARLGRSRAPTRSLTDSDKFRTEDYKCDFFVFRYGYNERKRY